MAANRIGFATLCVWRAGNFNTEKDKGRATVGHRSRSGCWDLGLYDVTTDSVGQTRCVDIRDQPYVKAAQASVGVELRLMGRQDGGDKFDFRNDLARHDDVCPESLANWLRLVDNRNSDLSFQWDACCAQFRA